MSRWAAGCWLPAGPRSRPRHLLGADNAALLLACARRYIMPMRNVDLLAEQNNIVLMQQLSSKGFMRPL